MNKKERVLTAVAGGKPDRVPVCFWHHFGDIPAEETVKQHIRYFEESGEDVLKMMCDEFFIYPLGDAKTPEEYLALAPQGKDSYYVRGQAERASQILAAMPEEAVTFYNAFTPYATLKHAIGQDAAVLLIRNHPDAAKHLLNIICEDTVYMIEAVLKDGGVTGMMLCMQGAEQGLFTDEEYETFLRPGEVAIIDKANELSELNLMHICGWDNTPDILERWKDYKSKIVNWDVHVEGISMKEGKEFFGGRCVLGGFNNRIGELISTGTEEEVKAFTKELIADTGEEGFIIGADCSVPQDIDHKRLHWVVEAAEEYAAENRYSPLKMY